MERYKYSAYGKCTILAPDGVTVRTESTIGNHILFTGREYDAETGLYYYRARYYSAELGRFLQRDPLGYHDSMNLYEYVGSNPVNGVDPLGLAETISRNAKDWYAQKEKERQASNTSPVKTTPPSNENKSSGGSTRSVKTGGRVEIKTGYSWGDWLSIGGAFFEGVGEGALDLVGYSRFQENLKESSGTGDTIAIIVGTALTNIPGASGAFDAQIHNEPVGKAIVKDAVALTPANEIKEMVGGSEKSLPERALYGIVAAGKTATAILTVIGVGSALKGKTSPVKTGPTYEADISQAGSSRGSHRYTANKQIYNELKKQPQKNAEIIKHMESGKGQLKNPPGTEWHHPINNPNKVQLFPSNVHRGPGMHLPDGRGGYSLYNNQQ